MNADRLRILFANLAGLGAFLGVLAVFVTLWVKFG